MENHYQLAYSQRLSGPNGPNTISTHNSLVRKHHVLRGKFQDSETYIIMAIVSKEDPYLLRQLSSIYIQRATTKEELPVLGMRQFAVTYGKLPSHDGKLPLRVAAALAWRGALSSSPFLIPIRRSFINQHHCNPTRVVVISESPCMTNINS